MPTTRLLTPDELTALDEQGIDSAQYAGKPVVLASDDEVASQQQATPSVTTTKQPSSYGKTIADTLKAHAGQTLGGGGGALAGAEGGAAVGTLGGPIGTLIGGLVGAAGGALAGGYGGRKLQEAIVPEDIQKKLEEEQQQSAQDNPNTALATDIIGSALASGGKPNIKNFKSLAGLGKVGMSALVNPAINSGVNYLATGETPTAKDLGAQVIGGALMSGQSKWAAKLTGHGGVSEQEEPLAKVTPEAPSDVVPVQTSPFTEKGDDGQYNIDDTAVKQAYRATVNKQPDSTGLSPEDAYAAQSQYRRANKLSPDEMRDALHNKYVEDMQKASDTQQLSVNQSAIDPLSGVDATAKTTPLTPSERTEQLLNTASDLTEGQRAIEAQTGEIDTEGEQRRTKALSDQQADQQAKEQAYLARLSQSETSAAPVEQPLNPGGSLESLSPELQAQSNSVKDKMKAEYETLKAQAKAKGKEAAPLVEPSTMPKEESPQDLQNQLQAENAGMTVDEWLASKKIGPDQSVTGIHPLVPVVWNGGIDAVRASLKAGKTMGRAVQDGVEWVQKNHPDEPLNPEQFRSTVTQLINQKGTSSNASSSTRTVEQDNRTERERTNVNRTPTETGSSDSLLSGEREGKEGKEVTLNNRSLPFTRSMIDSIRRLDHPLANKVADAFQNTLAEREQRVGATWNKIKSVMDKVGFTEADGKQLQKVAEYENLNHEAAPSTMLRNNAQRQVYNTERAVYDESGKYRLANNEPVFDKGVPRRLQQDPYAHPTTPNPKIVEMYKSGADKVGIAKADKAFLDNAAKYGKTPEQAKDLLQQFKIGIQGDANQTGSNMQYYNAARRAQGIPLPKEFTRSDYAQNLEAYYHRQANDNTFYKNVESNPEVMSALGHSKDAWGNAIPRDPTGGIAGNGVVMKQLKQFQGETSGSFAHNEKGALAAATAAFIASPALEVHKVGSNLIGISALTDNPVQTMRMYGRMITNFRAGLEHATENGVQKLTARSAYDFFQRNSTFAERMQAIAQGIRNVSTLGSITTKLNNAMMQAGSEYLLPEIVKKANAGNTDKQQFMKNLDTSYTVGKDYTPEQINKLASQMVGYIHGTGDGRTMPSWMSGDSEVSGFFSLAHWSVAQTNRFMKDVYTPLTKGNYQPFIQGALGAAVGGYVIKELREAIQGKHGAIPDLNEIAASEKGLEGNKGLLAYNAIAAMQYAGFGGLISQVAKYPFDLAYNNQPQGATFPIDEIAMDTAKTVSDAIKAAMHSDGSVNAPALVTEVARHMLTQDVQMGRIGINQAINNGLIAGSAGEKKALNDKLGQLRRFKQVSGLPVEDNEPSTSNPYMNLDQKDFKRTQDITKAAQELPSLINGLIAKWGDKPDILQEKLKGLKQNSYATMPNPDTMAPSFVKYVQYLQRFEGIDKAEEAVKDYFTHKVVNEAKASMVP